MRRVIHLMGRFFRLVPNERLLLIDALLWLTLARMAIIVLPFRHIGRLASRPVRGRKPSKQSRTAPSRRIRWAVVACARRVPWRAMCFEQGLAAHLMLRRRGVPSVLYYGAAPDHFKGLSAHVWVRDGEVDVVGCEVASRFALLATFPPQDHSSGQ
jgi:hypothetical protein